MASVSACATIPAVKATGSSIAFPPASSSNDEKSSAPRPSRSSPDRGSPDRYSPGWYTRSVCPLSCDG
jgi:hypothetical protein